MTDIYFPCFTCGVKRKALGVTMWHWQEGKNKTFHQGCTAEYRCEICGKYTQKAM
jgi:hypothetical protein